MAVLLLEHLSPDPGQHCEVAAESGGKTLNPNPQGGKQQMASVLVMGCARQ